MTQEVLADRSGVSVDVIAKLEQGWRMFDALLRYWQARNRYTPEWQA